LNIFKSIATKKVIAVIGELLVDAICILLRNCSFAERSSLESQR